MEFIQTIQQLRSPLMDLFFIGLNFFDTGAFFFLLIPAIWFGKGWKSGLKLFAILLLSTFFIGYFKNLFANPRPFHILPNLAVIQVPGYSFPSGGATNSMLLSCLLLTHSKSRFKWPIALSFVFFVSLSRIYLGVHFLTDVLAGWVLGLLLWGFFLLAFPPIERWMKKRSFLILFLLSQAIPIMLIFLQPPIRETCSIAMGITLSLFFIRPTLTKTIKESLVKGALGAILSFLFYLGTKYLFHPSTFLAKFAVAFGMGFGIGLLGAYLCNKISFHKQKKKNP
ncbi:MAG: phosphatase PAP2 family protein [Verrucomicrobia bacterium]|nr:phosphatase PAP2 family protein [Verrucomicrobiota bacterium]